MSAEDRDDSVDEVGAVGADDGFHASQAGAQRTAAASSSAPKVDAQTLELRAAPAAVTRLNRRTLMVLIGGVALLVMMATIWSLQPRERKGSDSTELYNVDRISRAEGLATLPSDYSQLPQPKPPEPPPVLGDPLPGDLGRPVLRAEREAGMHPHGGPDAAEAERLARLKEAEEAARSPLFYKSSQRGGSATGGRGAASGGLAAGFDAALLADAGAQAGAVDAVPSQNLQGNKAAFARGGEVATQSAHGLTAARAPYTLMAGTVISAALITGIKSDLPGDVMATVTSPVYDSATGEHLLIPQGSRLMGRYNSQVAYGQSRVQAVWERVILPDTSSVTLDSLAATDPAGFAGLEDDVDWHWDRILAGAALTTLLGVSAELAAPNTSGSDGRIVIATRDSVQDSVNQVGQEMTRRNMNIQPTLTIRQGMPVRVIVNRDVTLRPYRPLFINR